VGNKTKPSFKRTGFGGCGVWRQSGGLNYQRKRPSHREHGNWVQGRHPEKTRESNVAPRHPFFRKRKKTWKKMTKNKSLGAEKVTRKPKRGKTTEKGRGKNNLVDPLKTIAGEVCRAPFVKEPTDKKTVKNDRMVAKNRNTVT